MGFAALSRITFPWDTLDELTATAQQHPAGMIDLSMGTPVDPTPEVVREALAEAADAPAYPRTVGTYELRLAVVQWFARRRGVAGLTPDQVAPTIGSKEAVGLLPSLLGCGPGDVVVYPTIAYPTYAAGVVAAGATGLAADDVAAWEGRDDVRMVWVNSPANPHGRVLDVSQLRRVVDAARRIGAVVVSDECYAELGWGSWAPEQGGVPSVLDPRVCGDSHHGLLVAYSLSKQSNLAGYRAAFLAGDAALVADVVARRKHLGLIVPAPIQAAMVAALNDDAHVASQREKYAVRRRLLQDALVARGFSVDSEAGLYLWVADPADRERGGDGADGTTLRGFASVPTLGNSLAAADMPAPLSAPSRQSNQHGAHSEHAGRGARLAQWFAQRGVLVVPGRMYGLAGADHVRVALTASDDQVKDAVSRITLT